MLDHEIKLVILWQIGLAIGKERSDFSSIKDKISYSMAVRLEIGKKRGDCASTKNNIICEFSINVQKTEDELFSCV